jgi:hypothetical protein
VAATTNASDGGVGMEPALMGRVCRQ